MQTKNRQAKPTRAALDKRIARAHAVLGSPMVPTARTEAALRALYAERYDYRTGSIAERLEAVEAHLELERALLSDLGNLNRFAQRGIDSMRGADGRPDSTRRDATAAKRYGELKANIEALRAVRRALLDKR